VPRPLRCAATASRSARPWARTSGDWAGHSHTQCPECPQNEQALAAAAAVPTRAPRPLRYRAAGGPRLVGTLADGPSAGTWCPLVGGPGCPAPGCRIRALPQCERGRAPDTRSTRGAVATRTRAAVCQPVAPGRRPVARTRQVPPPRPARWPTRPVPPRYRSLRPPGRPWQRHLPRGGPRTPPAGPDGAPVDRHLRTGRCSPWAWPVA